MESNTESKERNPYYQAVEARSVEEADRLFDRLMSEMAGCRPEQSEDGRRESVVSSILYTSGYYDEATRERVVRLYAHRSPYRRRRQ